MLVEPSKFPEPKSILQLAGKPTTDFAAEEHITKFREALSVSLNQIILGSRWSLCFLSTRGEEQGAYDKNRYFLSGHRATYLVL